MNSSFLIYLDNCCFNRPFDDQTQLRIYLETEAKLHIQYLIKENAFLLVWSFILDYENSANPDDIVKTEIFEWRKSAELIVSCNPKIVNKAIEINKLNFSKKDSLHLACAIEAKTAYFITVDKGILKNRNLISGLNIMNPIEFISFLEDENEK